MGVTGYADGTDGHAGSSTSADRAVNERDAGTTSVRRRMTLRALSASGSEGMTWKELGRYLGLHHGQSSGVLANLHREGQVARLTEQRHRCKVYVTPENVGERPTEVAGETSTTRLLRDMYSYIESLSGMTIHSMQGDERSARDALIRRFEDRQ